MFKLKTFTFNYLHILYIKKLLSSFLLKTELSLFVCFVHPLITLFKQHFFI